MVKFKILFLFLFIGRNKEHVLCEKRPVSAADYRSKPAYFKFGYFPKFFKFVSIRRAF